MRNPDPAPGLSGGSSVEPHKFRALEEKRAYVYPALPDGNFVRMLTLNPGERDDPLKGTIELVNIDSPGSYEPLSYVWGVPEFLHEISIQDESSERILKLTPSLYGALKRLRLPHGKRRL